MKEQRQTANLKPFAKGASGNPAGRPKGSRNVTTLLKTMLDRVAPEFADAAPDIARYLKRGKRPTYADAIAARLMYAAIERGEAWAIKEILDRTEGKAPQTVDVTADVTAYPVTLAEWRAEYDAEVAARVQEAAEAMADFED